MISKIKAPLLSPSQLTQLANDLDELKHQALAKVGSEDAKYIRKIEKLCRYLGGSGRILLMMGWFIPFWIAGTILLALAKIIENMELGHNVMHGQYNFIQDPRFRGSTYEWDIVGLSDHWRKTHNYSHHTYTNIAGKDHDIGYSVLRLFRHQKWHFTQLLQPIYAVFFAILFQWGVAAQNMRFGRLLKNKISLKEFTKEQKPAFGKMGKQVFKDYLFFPLIAGPFFIQVILGNLCANILRNIWGLVA